MIRKKWQIMTLVLTVVILFFIPLFWLKSWFVNLGGDAGRFYFLDPAFIASHIHAWGITSTDIGLIDNVHFSYLPFDVVNYLLLRTLNNPTLVIGASYGIILAFSYLSVLLFVRALLKSGKQHVKEPVNLAACVSAFVYVSLVTVYGWERAMPVLNTVYVYPLFAYMFLKYLIVRQRIFMYGFLLFSLVASIHFSYSNFPFFLAFMPFMLAFILMYVRVILGKRIAWQDMIIFGALYIGIQAFQMLPTVMSFLARSANIGTDVFSSSYIQSGGVHYFDFNRYEFGKISTSLFQPAQFFRSGIYVLFVPVILILGFMKKPSKLLALSGICFAITLFLVSANITKIGGELYRLLFFLPGFVMFRSFWEKWYWVYAFFYTLTFAVSFYFLLKGKKLWFSSVIALLVIAVTAFRVYPFLQGKTIRDVSFQGNSVSPVFRMDTDFLDAINEIKKFPQDGKVLTLPLTFPNYQIFWGKEGGAYMGISAVSGFAARPDFSGFWSFGPYEKAVFDAIKTNDSHAFLQLLSFLNVRYVFRNSDPRVMNNFPGFPLTFPGATYSSRDDLPAIRDQDAYTSFLASLPLTKIYEKGFYSMYEINDSYVRPLIYIPDEILTSQEAASSGSFQSAYVEPSLCDKIVCGEEQQVPEVHYAKKSPVSYDVSIELKGRKTPFLVIFSNAYYESWILSFEKEEIATVLGHVPANGYANGWIVDPAGAGVGDVVRGTIYCTYQNYFYLGSVISGVTLMTVLFLSAREITRRKHAAK
jgi:hypothetical protein